MSLEQQENAYHQEPPCEHGKDGDCEWCDRDADIDESIVRLTLCKDGIEFAIERLKGYPAHPFHTDLQLALRTTKDALYGLTAWRKKLDND